MLTNIAVPGAMNDFVAMQQDYTIILNGVEWKPEQPVVTINNHTYLPLREMGEALNADIVWSQQQQCIYVDAPMENGLNLYPFEENGKFGYKNKQQEVIIEPYFNAAYPFHEGLASVCPPQYNTSNWGCINFWGRLVIPARYNGPVIFSNGFAAVTDANTGSENFEHFYINKDGVNVFKKTFTMACDFSEGYARVLKKGWPDLIESQEWSYINTDGAYATDMTFEKAKDFSGGFAAVKKMGNGA